MTWYPAAIHEHAIRRPSTPPPSTAMGRDEVSGGVHWGWVVLEAEGDCVEDAIDWYSSGKVCGRSDFRLLLDSRF